MSNGIGKKIASLLRIKATNGHDQALQRSEQAVIVYFSYGSTNLTSLHALASQLKLALESSNAGEYDGEEVAVDGSDGSLYMYGPNADRVLDIARPILQSAPFMKGAKITKRYGGPNPGVKEETIII